MNSQQDHIFEPENKPHKKGLNYFFTLIKLAALLFVIYQFNIEKDSNLNRILPVIGVGFAIHFWLNQKYKLPFFLFLSFTAILFVLGIFNGLVLIAIGLLLILICHIPIKYNYRLILLIFSILLLMVFRASIINIHPVPMLTPYIGTIFLLRIILYMYELKHNDNYQNIWHRLSYFFLLPNICFPLFPLVDFKVLIQTYYNNDAQKIYNLGILRIFRAIIHLLCYKAIYFFLVPEPSDVDGLYKILQFIIFTYILILRISGMFHLVLGILCLFGFNLPEIFNNYFFASSFNDIWRRINTYWRDALMKIFYYPIYFKFKKWNLNNLSALSLTIFIVFIFNWLMHGYQWFWVRGNFPTNTSDFLFWMVFGVFVMFNSIYLQKDKKPKKLNKAPVSGFKMASLNVIKSMSMFFFMGIIWMMWSSSSLKEWWYLLSFFKSGSIKQWSITISILTGIIILAIFLTMSYRNNGFLYKIIHFYNKNINGTTTIFIILLVIISFPNLSTDITLNKEPFIKQLQENRLNLKDKKIMERGYYQKLLNNDNTSVQLWQNQITRPPHWTRNKAQVPTNDLRRKKFGPNRHVMVKGKEFITNSFGMRDKEYSLQKPANTYRFVLLGASYELGAGIDKNYESITEELLNDKYKKPIEILNYSVGGYQLLDGVYNVQHDVFKYNPDAVIYTAHSNELYRLVNKFSQICELNLPIKDTFLLNIISISGIENGMSQLEISNRLRPYVKSVVKWGYYTIASQCKKRGVEPVWVYLPALGDGDVDEDYEIILSIAKDAGFVIIPLDDVYNNYDKTTLMLASWDTHPNKKGHEIIANKLFKELTSHEKELNLK